MCRTVCRVALALCARMNDFVFMPEDNKKLNDIRHKFHAMAGFPDVIGCIDVTHMKIAAPPVDENA